MKIDTSSIKLSRYDKERNINIPNKITKDIAYLSGILAGDGHISSKNKDKSRNRIWCGGNPKDEKEFYDVTIVQLFKGIFNINLDVSSITFGGQYWLETEIAGEVLSPRTRLTSAPYSLAPWGQNGSAVYYTEGKVGIGTTSPSVWAKLHVAGGDLTFDDNASHGIMWITLQFIMARRTRDAGCRGSDR